MNEYHRLRIAGNDDGAELELPEQVQLAIDTSKASCAKACSCCRSASA
jgi:hypothetical protein